MSLLEDEAQFFLYEAYTEYICALQWCAHPAVFKASRCRYLRCGAFSPWQSCRPRARRYWVPGYFGRLHRYIGTPCISMRCVWTNQNLIRNDDQQQPRSRRALCLPSLLKVPNPPPPASLCCCSPTCRNSGLVIEASIETGRLRSRPA